ncbi:aminotransferase class I/II-fold pyridoxal phosphate-dependent enzyme [Chryseobacterium rhizosphaerae]|jgi:glutamate/tyrosine decarboxylase-like PLP-dependent enzyme|uniref:Aspartate aminotransferase family protein n=1 Tax=Chryseobacterium rhizosphaerae TaxID=395937 RepID=A0ABX9IQ04_9FLAO|nr:aminotransferase class I/II-fold pyridoxal phosphate-dependent enzyme [Chryseobacterium rhizosphaerae]MDC8102599.1 pyridoxal-dependent decarboxylase [Chryseobacterium rhizosphaerae]REC77755.1 aspartate aminotransferase family protein [Chryseobacterium rhizosphaerae]GEN67037.1 cytochrome d ubiquinol oxidase subunit I [Chryseobacterium rhizosphaerae]
MYWAKLQATTIRERVFDALNKNLNYNTELILGLPGTYLDQGQFYNFPFLKEAAFLSVLVNNPNHIGCHTYSEGEKYFSGTQQLEIDLLRICAVEILGAEESGYDGYVAPGGTEANIQAQWMYRNYFMQNENAKAKEIGVIFSEDAHYSVYKGSNLLGIHPITVKVEHDTREILLDDLNKKLEEAYNKGIRYLIIHLSMGTTIFGSVDSPEPVLKLVKQYFKHYFVHVDAAFGGFIYPFSSQKKDLSFENPEISSITIDGHKMLQSPYGTGVFLCRKSLIEYVQTPEASYVYGSDFTLCGSRSGANAISMWMILMTHGSEGWSRIIQELIDRADYLCNALNEMGIKYYRNPDMNIITIDANEISEGIAEKYYLVADNYLKPQWRKVVVMAHVKKEMIDLFLLDLKKEREVLISK